MKRERTARKNEGAAVLDVAARIPEAITALLAVKANENLDLCGQPFSVEAWGDGWVVTMHTTKYGSGDDVEVRVVLTGADGTKWSRREWSEAERRMTDWSAQG